VTVHVVPSSDHAGLVEVMAEAETVRLGGTDVGCITVDGVAVHQVFEDSAGSTLYTSQGSTTGTTERFQAQWIPLLTGAGNHVIGIGFGSTKPSSPRNLLVESWLIARAIS
jgi:hypothetical protein